MQNPIQKNNRQNNKSVNIIPIRDIVSNTTYDRYRTTFTGYQSVRVNLVAGGSVDLTTVSFWAGCSAGVESLVYLWFNGGGMGIIDNSTAPYFDFYADPAIVSSMELYTTGAATPPAFGSWIPRAWDLTDTVVLGGGTKTFVHCPYPSLILSAVGLDARSFASLGGFVKTAHLQHDALAIMLNNSFDSIADYQLNLRCLVQGDIDLTFNTVSRSDYDYVVVIEYPHLR